MKLVTYFFSSLIAFVFTVWYSYKLHTNFYPTVIYLTTNKLCILGLGNFSFSLALSITKLMIRLLFKNIHDDENNEIINKSKYAIVEICIALTSFRGNISTSTIILFFSLLFIKVFHWLSHLRMENFARALPNENSNFRLFFTLILLLFIDLINASFLAYIMYSENQFSVLALFVFEYLILFVATIQEIFRFIILIIDRHYGGKWSYKPTVIFAIEHIHDLLHLGLYIVFVIVLFRRIGFPIHLLREVILGFHQLTSRINKFVAYRKLIKVLDTQFPDITKEEIESNPDRDARCLICFDDINIGKELPCSHIFHLDCLKRWFEQKQECPMCKRKIKPDYKNTKLKKNKKKQKNQSQQQLQQPNNNNNNNNNMLPPHQHPPPPYAYPGLYPPHNQPPQVWAPPPINATFYTPNKRDKQKNLQSEKKENTEEKEEKENKLPPIPNTMNIPPGMLPPPPHMVPPFGHPMPFPPHPMMMHPMPMNMLNNVTPPMNLDNNNMINSLNNTIRNTEMQLEYHQFCIDTLSKQLQKYNQFKNKWKNKQQNENSSNNINNINSSDNEKLSISSDNNNENDEINENEIQKISSKHELIQKRLKSFQHLERSNSDITDISKEKQNNKQNNNSNNIIE